MVLSGIGYDVHALTDGRPLILGGIEIAHERGLLGHSDADVLAHAIADALLGAVGAGDIGHHFPDTDESIRGIRSTEILAEVSAILAAKSAHIINIDATVIAEAPKLAPHIQAMRQALGSALQTPFERINIKATTNEGLGFLGRREGIAALAVASVEQPEPDESTAPPLPAVGI